MKKITENAVVAQFIQIAQMWWRGKSKLNFSLIAYAIRHKSEMEKTMSQSVKKSVRLSPETVGTIRQISNFGEVNWSGSLNDIASRYMLLVKHSLPELSENEKMALAVVFNGKLFDSRYMDREAKALHIHIGYAIESDGHFVEWLWRDSDLDLEAFIKSDAAEQFYKRVTEWTIPERLAVIHYVTAFWSPKLISLDDSEDDDG